MKKNMGITDRLIRTILTITIVVLYFEGMISGIALIILGVFALIFLATSLIGFCPLYLPLKINTSKGEK